MPFNPYSIDTVAGTTDEFLVIWRGAKVGVASSLDEAADLAAADAVAGYPHVGMGLLEKAAERVGRPLTEVVKADRFWKELASLIAESRDLRFSQELGTAGRR
jgi:hypothetical protein